MDRVRFLKRIPSDTFMGFASALFPFAYFCFPRAVVIIVFLQAINGA